MKDFDDLAKRIAPFSLRYADDNFLAFYTLIFAGMFSTVITKAYLNTIKVM